MTRTAVVLLNVLGFYGPLRDLLRSGVRAGFIQPSNESLVRFVDGPENPEEHATFDWGQGERRIFENKRTFNMVNPIG